MWGLVGWGLLFVRRPLRVEHLGTSQELPNFVLGEGMSMGGLGPDPSSHVVVDPKPSTLNPHPETNSKTLKPLARNPKPHPKPQTQMELELFASLMHGTRTP